MHRQSRHSTTPSPRESPEPDEPTLANNTLLILSSTSNTGPPRSRGPWSWGGDGSGGGDTISDLAPAHIRDRGRRAGREDRRGRADARGRDPDNGIRGGDEDEPPAYSDVGLH